MKRINVVSLLIGLFVLVFAVPVFAETSLKEVQAKMERVKNSGIKTLEQVQAELRRADDQRQLAVIKGIIHNYEVLYGQEFTSADVHEISLPLGKTVSHIATELISGGGKNTEYILKANQISPEQARELNAGRKLYVLTRMINKEFILNPYEVALMKKEIAAAKAAVKSLTTEVVELRETVVLQKDEINELGKALEKEQKAHTETKVLLTETTRVLDKTTKVLSEKKAEYSNLQGWVMIIGIIILAVIVGTVIYFLLNRKGSREKITARKAELKEQREDDEFFTTRGPTGRPISTMEEKSKGCSSLDSSLLAV